MAPKPRPLVDRFMEKVEITDGCWNWKGCTQGCGYGMILVGRSKKLAHRVSWEMATGRKVQKGKIVLHTCDNPGCVNPDHLVEGTQRDNMGDRALKRGDNHAAPYSRLSPEDVRSIVSEYRKGGTQSDIGKTHGVSAATISLIIRGRTWSHVTKDLELPSRRRNSKDRVLDPSKVETIRREYKKGSSQKSLAMEHGISKSLVQQIVTGKAWTHVEDDDG